MGCCHWHHCEPYPDPYRYSSYRREAETYPPRRSRFAQDAESDLRDRLQDLEDELAAVRRELEETTSRGESSG